IVQLGEPVTFTCANMESRTWIYWYKQTSGDTLKMIVKQRKTMDPNNSPEFPSSRFKVTNDDKISNLTIMRTVEQDEGMYHCAIIHWTGSTWMGTYLMVKGNTLQCSVLSESENNSCSEDLSMFWFKAGSNRSYPNIIYTDGKRADNCKKSPNTGKKCIYNFPKNISSSDPGTYYCAVATCGEILLGNVIRKEGDAHVSFFSFLGQTPLYKIPILLITITIMTFSLTVNVILICYQSHDLAGQIIKGKCSLLNNIQFLLYLKCWYL
uniref:Ig-like domain-containing protein n=1 Tax=Cyprinodon variegatus TaxID=28743 RepID=A0A3Q2DM74_CYPVA